MKNFQLLSLVPDRDCTLVRDLRQIGRLRYSTIDCNGLTGTTVSDDDFSDVIAALTAKGWQHISSERGGPEGIGTAYLDNPNIPRTPPYRSPEMVEYLANRRN